MCRVVKQVNFPTHCFLLDDKRWQGKPTHFLCCGSNVLLWQQDLKREICEWSSPVTNQSTDGTICSHLVCSVISHDPSNRCFIPILNILIVYLAIQSSHTQHKCLPIPMSVSFPIPKIFSLTATACPSRKGTFST